MFDFARRRRWGKMAELRKLCLMAVLVGGERDSKWPRVERLRNQQRAEKMVSTTQLVKNCKRVDE